MYTEDGRTVDLGSLCNKIPEDSGNRSGNISVQQCYFLDADGRPCTTAASNGQNTQQRDSLQRDQVTVP